MFPFLGSLIGAGASLFGSSMNNAAQNQANVLNYDLGLANMQQQQAMNTQNIAAQEAINTQNIAEQEKFAKSGIQWRTADAKAAGINPLAALGAQTQSFSNQVAPQGVAPQNTATFKAGSPGAGVAAAGQNISRAMQSMQSPEDRAVAIEKTRIDLENGQLQNELLKSQIFNSNVRTVAPTGTPGLRGVPRDDSETTDVVGPDGVPLNIASHPMQGEAWINPLGKEQYFVRDQLLPWFGYNIPDTAYVPSRTAVGARGAIYKNPFTGRLYEASGFTGDALWQQFKDYQGMNPGGFVGP
jgi:hypothetical protein